MGLRGGGRLVPSSVKWSKLNEIHLDEYFIYSKLEPPVMAVSSQSVSFSPNLSVCCQDTGSGSSGTRVVTCWPPGEESILATDPWALLCIPSAGGVTCHLFFFPWA